MYNNIYLQVSIFLCELKNVSLWAPLTTIIENSVGAALGGHRKKSEIGE